MLHCLLSIQSILICFFEKLTTQLMIGYIVWVFKSCFHDSLTKAIYKLSMLYVPVELQRKGSILVQEIMARNREE